jgi:hypothetical protein
MALEFLFMSPGFIYFLCSGSSKALSVGVLVVIKCIYLPPTYLNFMKDIENRFLLLTRFTSFIDLPFQEHQMMKKHHMD